MAKDEFFLTPIATFRASFTFETRKDLREEALLFLWNFNKGLSQLVSVQEVVPFLRVVQILPDLNRKIIEEE